MKSQKFKRVIVVLLVTAMAVAIPSSFAKYADTVTIGSAMTVKKKMFSIFNTYPGISKEECIVRLPQVGYYAIIAKGGDGANGDAYASNGLGQAGSSKGYKIEGGIGGTVVGVYQTTESNQYIYVAPGAAGVRPNKDKNPGDGTVGEGGQNAFENKFYGGKGSTVTGLVAITSQAPASGGGGAATLVYKCNEKGVYNTRNDSDVLFVAAGGGAGGSWNEDYRPNSGIAGTNLLGTTDAPGFGGDGGSNYFGGNVSAPIVYSNSSYVFSFSNKYDGFNGTGLVSSIDTRGKAGTSSGYGTGGTSNKTGYNLITGQTASSGATFANGGTGGNGAQYGGGGGAGYNGGGGGSSTGVRQQSNLQPAGGGGGGASYVASSIIQTMNVDYASIIDSVISGNNCIPVQHPIGDCSADGDGYVIIKYLGSSLPNESITVMASAMSRNIVQKYTNSTTSTAVTNNKTNDNFYKALMEDAAIADFLRTRLWTINYETCERVDFSINAVPVLYFSDEKNITPNDGAIITVWRYKEGELSRATNVKASKTNVAQWYSSPSYEYSLKDPSTGTYTKADFALN